MQTEHYNFIRFFGSDRKIINQTDKAEKGILRMRKSTEDFLCAKNISRFVWGKPYFPL